MFGALGMQAQGSGANGGGGGGPVDASQITGLLPIEKGGTGQTTAEAGLEALGGISAEQAALTYAPLVFPTFPYSIKTPGVGILDSNGVYAGSLYAAPADGFGSQQNVALNSGGIDMVSCEHLRVSLGGSRGQHSFEVITNYHHINRLSVSGSDTGMAPTLSAVGSDADIGMELITKGEGGIILAPGGNTALTLNSGAATFDVPVTIPSGSTVTGYAPLAALFTMLFGDGSDGDLLMPASGTINLVRDMYYRNVAWPVNSSAAINPGGFRIFVSNRLYGENAPPGAIIRSGAAGGNGGATGTAGAAGLSVGGTTIGGGLAGGAGATGSAANATAGAAAANGTANGGTSAASGAGGPGGTGSGGAATPGPTATVADIRQPKLDLIRMVSAINGGLGGNGGGGGGGDGGSGGGGGGGASAAGVIAIYARRISRGATSGWIQANGALGGTGGSPTAGNRGGGGGASGSGGGWVYIVCDELLGDPNPDAIQANGGAGGPGGNGSGTGRGGTGGGSGAGGRATVIELSTATTTVTVGAVGVAGMATPNATGGAGAPATLFSADL
jgi:hypothetical protein